jgi:hypothetical protein
MAVVAMIGASLFSVFGSGARKIYDQPKFAQKAGDTRKLVPPAKRL